MTTLFQVSLTLLPFTKKDNQYNVQQRFDSNILPFSKNLDYISIMHEEKLECK